jgi:hypothetical protein
MHETQVTADCDKIEPFRLYIVLDSPAEEWYVDTGSLIRVWADFKTEFQSRFPGIQKVKKTTAKLKREMVDLVLKTEDLDKIELYGGVKVEMYKVHMKKLFELAKQAKINARMVNTVHI